MSARAKPELDPQIEALVTEFYRLRIEAGDHPLLAREYAVMLARDLYYPTQREQRDVTKGTLHNEHRTRHD